MHAPLLCRAGHPGMAASLAACCWTPGRACLPACICDLSTLLSPSAQPLGEGDARSLLLSGAVLRLGSPLPWGSCSRGWQSLDPPASHGAAGPASTQKGGPTEDCQPPGPVVLIVCRNATRCFWVTQPTFSGARPASLQSSIMARLMPRLSGFHRDVTPTPAGAT